MKWLRKILGLEWRDQRLEKLEVLQKALLSALNPLVSNSDETHTWTSADAAAWKRIMESDLGRKMLHLTKQAHFRMCQSASANTVRPELEIHCARGFFEGIKWLRLMTISPTVEGVSQPLTDGAHGEAPSTDQELAAVLARLSPN